MNPYLNKVFSPAQFKRPEVPQGILSDIPSDSKNSFSVRFTTPIVILSVLILVVCILTFPLPARIDLTLPGGRIDAEGNLIQEGTIHLEGWQYNYLLREDKMKVSVEVMDLTLSHTNWKKQIYSNYLGDFRHMVQFVYIDEWNIFELCEISLAHDDSWFLIQIGTCMYFGSLNPDMDANAIIDECYLVIH